MCPLWGPLVVMPFKSPFVSNRMQDMGLEIRRTLAETRGPQQARRE
jgi:hypothetical protein